MLIATEFKRWALLIAALALAGSTAMAQANENEPYPRIVVSAEGTARLEPDTATVTLTVTREAKSAREALDANSTAMGEVLAAMQAEGIEKRDLQTSNFSIRPRYNYPNPKSNGERGAPQIVGYTVRNSLSVRIRKMERLGLILDKSVTLGVNEGGQIQFTNQDPSPALEEARIAAVQAAIAKANTLAKAAGVNIGKLLEISEYSMSPRPMPMARAEMAMARSADAVPVAAGENTYTVTVNATFAIDQ